jgi:16S rRNA C967 or C1407 C5-methylase (RsmB/RsmF family)
MYNKDMQNKINAKEDFLNYYRKILGEVLAEQIFIELTKKSSPILRFRPQDEKFLHDLWDKRKIPWKLLSWYSYALVWPEIIPLRTILPGFDERMIFAMNASSLIPVLSLSAGPGDIVLDACAAPGGKAMFIADELKQQGVLVANDLSSFRKFRMQQLFKAYDLKFTEVTNVDARIIFKKYPEHFDKILLDAPCSSEKHVYNNPKYLNIWSPSRIRRNKIRQIELIKTLSKALKPGGTLVYSTCAITPEENEEVITQALNNNNELQLALPLKNIPNDGALPVTGLNENDRQKLIRIHPGNNLDPMFVGIFKKSG